MAVTKSYLKMPASGNITESAKKSSLRLFGMENDTERGARFWNNNSVEMEFSVERDWMKSVRFAESKPKYGMRNLDPILEELTGNKLELVSPLLDGYIREIGDSIYVKLGRSRMIGLMALVMLFMLFQIFKHLWVLVQGYGGSAETSKNVEKITLTVTRPDTVEKIWSPDRFT